MQNLTKAGTKQGQTKSFYQMLRAFTQVQQNNKDFLMRWLAISLSPNLISSNHILFIDMSTRKKKKKLKGPKDNQITWSDTKNSQALETKHLIHEDTAATKAYTAEMALMQTMYLN